MSLNQSAMEQHDESPEKRREKEETGTFCPSFSKLSITDNPSAAVASRIRPDLIPILSLDYSQSFRAHPASPPALPVLHVPGQPTGVSSISSATHSSKSTSLFSRPQSSSTLPTRLEAEEPVQTGQTKDQTQHNLPSVPSSVQATDGSGSVTSVSTTDEIDLIWGQGDVANQFGVSSSRNHLRRKRTRKEQVVVVHQGEDGKCMELTFLMKRSNHPLDHIGTSFDHHDPGVLPLSNKQLSALTVLAIFVFTDLFVTMYAFILLTNGAVTLRQANCVLRLSTYILASCTATAMGVVRRPRYEVLGGFVAVLLVGSSIRTELFEWLL
jgi:hypothetical protein